MTSIDHLNPSSICSYTNSLKNPEGWHSRGYLPHFDGGSVSQAITFRLADSLPAAKYNEFSQALDSLPRSSANAALIEEIEQYLDQGLGSTYLASADIAELVQSELLHWDGKRYQLHAWVIMPNHVHALITPDRTHSLSKILHTWKSFTANQANRLLARSGPFWQRESFDQFVRDETHFQTVVAYIENNPVKARLCAKPENWRFSSATRNLAERFGTE